jgi:curved DNA-binding protein CbpA
MAPGTTDTTHRSPDDPFDLLGVEPQIDLDEDALRRRWLALAAMLHPDIAADPDQAGRELARISAAHATLSNPESRADALLVRRGGPSRDACRDLPAGFLVQIMDIREELEEALADDDQSAIARLRHWAAERRAAYTEEMRVAFAALGPEPSAESLRAIREQLNAWRYIERMIEQAG